MARPWQAESPRGNALLPARGWREGWSVGLRELAGVLVVTLAYFLTRGLVRGRESDAMANAWALLRLEDALFLDIERRLQALTLPHEWIIGLANGYYLYAHLPLLVGVALWLFWWRPWAYAWMRNAFLLSALFGLIIYVALPMAPPRFLPGYVDTMRLHGFDVDGSAAGAFYNPYAAMPSLHTGWSLLSGLAIIACTRAWWSRLIGGAIPAGMTLAVMVTGNHYLLDAVAGAAVVVAALALATLIGRRSPPAASFLRMPRRDAEGPGDAVAA